MKKLSCFIAGLFVFLMLAGSLFAQAQEARPPDFAEFERLAAERIPLIRDATFVPDYRATYIAQAKRFESFLNQYPASPLKPEALLRTALLYLNVEGREVHALRRALFFCQGEALEHHDQQKFDLCQQRFVLNLVSIGGTVDPIYECLARRILEGLVERYPHVKRYHYIRIGPGAGGFRFDDSEEIGTIALYILGQGIRNQ